VTEDLSRFKFVLIYLLLMLSAISIGIMISLLPVVARTANISDILIVCAQAITAGSWIFVAGAWARVAQRRGRKFVIMLGGVGLTLGCFATGGVIWVAITGLVAPLAALAMLVTARIANGAVGLAVVPAAQAFVIERTPISRRTVVMSSLASAQALGTILGPAAAPFMTHIPGLGLAGPMVIVAALCGLILPVLAVILPHDGPAAKAAIGTEAPAEVAEGIWKMKAMRGYLIYSTIMATAAIGLIQTIGFLVLDTVKGPAEDAQVWVGQAIAAGAVATLLVQLVVTPAFKPTPRTMMLVAPVISILGLAMLCLLPQYGLVVLGTVTANVGFALGRPGVATAASLALPINRQTELAAAILSTASAGVVIGPVLAVTLYTVWQPMPFVLLAATQAAAFAIALRRTDISNGNGLNMGIVRKARRRSDS
jgi:MFS family permease